MDKINIQNLDLYYNYDDRFKTSFLSFYFYLPYKLDYLVELSICKQLIQKTNALYKDEAIFNYKMKSMYNMRVSSSMMVAGDTCSFRVSVSFLNPEYVKENYDIVKEAVDLLYNCLFNIDFTTEKINLEKDLILKNLLNSYNNKTKYAIKRFKEIIYQDQEERKYLDIEPTMIERVTKETIMDAYHLILKSPCYLFLTGNLNKDSVVDRLNNFDLQMLTRYDYPNEFNFIDSYHKDVTNPHEVIEEQDINQTIMCIGYRSKLRKNSKLRIALAILSGMLGEYFHSTLFQIIREQNSLAYSVSSDVFLAKGMLFIFAKISNKNIELVKNIIITEFEKYQKGLIDENIFNLTKRAKINAILENFDSPLNPLYDLQEELMGFGIINDEILIERINNLTIDDIVDAANEFVLDTIYVLKGNK